MPGIFGGQQIEQIFLGYDFDGTQNWDRPVSVSVYIYPGHAGVTPRTRVRISRAIPTQPQLPIPQPQLATQSQQSIFTFHRISMEILQF